MAIAINIDVNTSYSPGAPTITMADLRAKVQDYVNSLRVNVMTTTPAEDVVAMPRHSLSSLRGICKSSLTDKQALDEYLSMKY